MVCLEIYRCNILYSLKVSPVWCFWRSLMVPPVLKIDSDRVLLGEVREWVAGCAVVGDWGDIWQFVQEIAFGILVFGENCADFMGIFCKRIHGWEWFVVVRFVGKGVESSVEKWGNGGVLLGGLAVEKWMVFVV